MDENNEQPDNIIDITDEAGAWEVNPDVRCIHCKHKWVAVYPLGTIPSECSRCHKHPSVIGINTIKAKDDNNV